MTQPQQAPETNSTTSSEVQLPAEKVITINVDDIKPNTILCINIAVNTPEEKMAVVPAFSKLLSAYAPKLREKGVTIMLMSLDESISLITEEEMNRAGWFKKAPSLIIKPFGE